MNKKFATKTEEELSTAILRRALHVYVGNAQQKFNPFFDEYVKSKKYSQLTLEKYQIGFADDKNSLTDQIKKDIQEKDHQEIIKIAIKLGLIRQDTDNSSLIEDRFKNRIMIPLYSLKGKIIGFTSQAFYPEQKARYMYSTCFNSSEVLFDFSKAKREIKEYDYVVITEGTANHIVLSQHGLKAVVSLMSSNVDDFVLDELLLLTRNVYLAFQSTSSAKLEYERLNKKLIERNAVVKYITFPDLQQPATFVINEGIEKLLRKLAKAKPFLSGDCFLPENIPKE